MDQNDKAILQDAVARFLREEYEQDFRAIFELSFQLLEVVLSTATEEVRMAFDHSARAITDEGFESGMRHLTRARWHIQRAKYVCLDAMISSQISAATVTLENVEKKRQALISGMEHLLSQLRIKRQSIPKMTTGRIAKLLLIKENIDESYAINGRLETLLGEINRFIILLRRESIGKLGVQQDNASALEQPSSNEFDELQERAGWAFAKLLNWHLQNGTRSNYAPRQSAKSWTRLEFSRAIDVSNATLATWLRGSRIPSERYLDRIEAELFGTSNPKSLKEFRTLLGRQTVNRPKIPASRPAAIEPVWIDGLLSVPESAAVTDLPVSEFEAALVALRKILRELVTDISSEANIDRRFVSFIDNCASSIPENVPPQTKLFEIGHMDSVFLAYARVVNDEWPSFLAARYHAAARQFDYTLRQSSSWRQFKRNVLKNMLEAEQIEPAIALTKEVVSVLREDEAVEFVDSNVPRVLEAYLNQFKASAENRTKPFDAIESGKEELATDLIESVNNVMKGIADAGLAALELTKGAGREVASIAGKAVGSFVGGFEQGAVSEAQKQGRASGRKAIRWLIRFATGGFVVTTGGGATYVAYHAVSKLMANFPEAFGWFENLAKFVKTLYQS